MMGPFVYCLATQAHDQLPDEISPKLCVVVGRVMKYREHLAIPMAHNIMYHSGFQINKNNTNEGQFLNALVIKKNTNVNTVLKLLLNIIYKISGRNNIANVLIIFKYRSNASQANS